VSYVHPGQRVVRLKVIINVTPWAPWVTSIVTAIPSGSIDKIRTLAKAVIPCHPKTCRKVFWEPLLAVFVLLIVVHCLVTLAIAFPWIDTFVNYGLLVRAIWMRNAGVAILALPPNLALATRCQLLTI